MCPASAGARTVENGIASSTRSQFHPRSKVMPAGGGLIESRLLPSPERIWMVLVQEVAGGVFLALADLVLACDHPQTEG